ncbi:chromosome segregation ATPase [Bacillus pakistanensis]|uniref:Chromosome segregation ATPase n=1 Tax=Rossellomorea pakistanensis TaxID=992288 RepID=A0ABS2NGD0_9BACI|nr:hypothetical protein [Bacillus pakistanensis]MBM7586921.1 chromosome segregation ATPase [Bacillus pakistanensis]
MTDKEMLFENTSGESYLEVLQDIHSISSDLESLYKQYTNRLKNLSEELAAEKSKHRLYQFEISDNHETIQTLSEQINHLQEDRQKRIETIYLLNKQLSQTKTQVQLKENSPKTEESSVTRPQIGQLSDRPPTQPPEIMIIYESNYQEKLLLIEQFKRDFISFLLDSKKFLLRSQTVYTDIEAYGQLISNEMKEVNLYKQEFIKKQKGGRWIIKMWNFLWGKSEENINPEVLKKLEVIESHLQSYSNKFKEVSESMKEKEERDKKTELYLEKMSSLHAELKKIEEYYEEELEALKTKLNEYKQKEVELQKEVSLLNKNLTEKQEPTTSEREEELEKELEILRKKLQSQSNKKNNMFQQMKNTANLENKKSQTEQMSNPEYEKYASVPMPNESKKTIFDPRRYNRS